MLMLQLTNPYQKIRAFGARTLKGVVDPENSRSH